MIPQLLTLIGEPTPTADPYPADSGPPCAVTGTLDGITHSRDIM